MELFAGEADASGEAVSWSRAGNEYIYESEAGSLSLQCTYEKNEELVSYTQDGLRISFAPLMNAGDEGPVFSPTELTPGTQVAENQTASNVLRFAVIPEPPAETVTGELQGAQSRSYSATPAPVVYEGLFDEASDVHLTAMDNGIKEDIVVQSYSGNHTYQYRVGITGAQAQLSGQEVLVQDEDGALRGVIQAPNMTDAAGVYSESIAVGLELLGSGEYLLTYTPDDAWMQGASYPVTIDPTYSTVNLPRAGLWAWHTGSQTIGPYLEVGMGSRTYVGVNRDYLDKYLRELCVDDVRLGFEGYNNSMEVSIHAVTETWHVGGAPGFGPEAGRVTISEGASYSGGITSIFKDWLRGVNPYYCVVLRGSSSRRVWARNNDRSPYLSITWMKPDRLKIKEATVLPVTGKDTVDLRVSWEKVAGAEGYYVGIGNGRSGTTNNYDWIYVDGGNTTSFSSNGRRLWPTAAEIAAGNPRLRTNGGGRELPVFPTELYNAVSGKPFKDRLEWFVAVTPAMNGKQMMEPSVLGATATARNYAIPPSQPKVDSIAPSPTNADSVKVTWSGATCIHADGKTDGTLGSGGAMEYRIFQTAAQQTSAAWLPTGSNKSAGSFNMPVSILADGVWYVQMRAKNSNGRYSELSNVSSTTSFIRDTTGPNAPTVSYTLEQPVLGWTRADSVLLHWSGVGDQYSGVGEVQYRIHSGTQDSGWHNAGTGAEGQATVDISTFLTGVCTIEMQAYDGVGNEGDIGTAGFQIDRDAPTYTPQVESATWSADGIRTLTWAGLSDVGAGLSGFTYALPGLAEQALGTAADGQQVIDVSFLPDGTHSLALSAKDQVGNDSPQTLPIYLDRAAPVVSLQEMNSTVRGFATVHGLVQDTSIQEWFLTAVGSSGKTIELNRGTANQSSGTVLGVLNAADFAHGETVTLKLVARDAVGYSTESNVLTLRIDRSTLALDGSNVEITAPRNGQQLTDAQYQGAYTLHAAGTEGQTCIFVDDGYAADANASGGGFLLDPARYAEDSVHRLYAMTRNTGGKASYSAGLESAPLGSHTFRDGSGVTFSGDATASGIGAVSASGGSVTARFTAAQSLMALRLDARGEGGISYQYSLDGASWHSITPGRDEALRSPSKQVWLRATLSAGSVLHGWSLEGVQENRSYPHTFSVKLLRAVSSFDIAHSRDIRNAYTEIETDGLPEGGTLRKYLYADGVQQDQSFTYHALTAMERTEHSTALFALTEAETLYGVSPANTRVLHREARDGTGTLLSGEITATDVFALRLAAVSHGGEGVYSYSLDGTTWSPLANHDYTLLPGKTQKVYLRAEMPSGAKLVAWHLEGVSGGARDFEVQTVDAPQQVLVADYGQYYDDPARAKYVISWRDPGPQDDTLAYETHYEVYRDGEAAPLAVVTNATRYTDVNYHEGATYAVQTVRTYADPRDGRANLLERRSETIAATAITPPQKPTVVVRPQVYFNAPEALLDFSGVSDFIPVTDIQYRILPDGATQAEADLAAYLSTGIADTSYYGFPVPVTAHAEDGPYVLQARSVHEDGLEDFFGAASVLIDRTPPVLSGLLTAPDTWTHANTLRLDWTGVFDLYSGVEKIEYAVNGGGWVDTGSAAEDDGITLDTAGLWDARHSASLRLTDKAGNSDVFSTYFYVDRTDPALALLSPVDGAGISGILEIHGTIWDLALQSWTLTAVGADGSRQPISSGTANQNAQLLGMWNTAGYAQDERVQLLLEAVDIAGNTHAVRNVYIKVDRSMQSLSGQVEILSPASNEALHPARVTGRYRVDASQAQAYLYVDGLLDKTAQIQDSTFVIDNVRYAENSNHTLSLIVRDKTGRVYYSSGLGTTVLMSDVFRDRTHLSRWDGAEFTTGGAAAEHQGRAVLVSKAYASALPIQTLRLKTTESIGSGSITYSYSEDDGATWKSFAPQYDAIVENQFARVRVRAEITGDAVLRGWELQAVSEQRPQRFSVEMLRGVKAFDITHSARVRQAAGELLNQLPAQVTDRWLLTNGTIHGNAFTYELLREAKERTQHTVQMLGISDEQVLYGGNGARTRILLREARDDSGTVTSGPVQTGEGIQAVRLEALSSGKDGKYYISANGTDWQELVPAEYKVIDSTPQVYVKAVMPAGSRLRGWHLEGVSVDEKAVRAQVLDPVSWLDVADYGGYFADDSFARYDLSWDEPNSGDATHSYRHGYIVYRNGIQIAQVSETRYTDEDYLENAVYSVRVVREYDTGAEFARRESPVTTGQVHQMIPPPSWQGVEYIFQEYVQSQFINDLYGGRYTFQPDAEPPSARMQEQGLLGPADYCELGFEPINFNTGNFFLMARDLSLESGGLTVTRTYNALSDEPDGAFGRKWASELNIHLELYTTGNAGLRDSEGALSMFFRQEDGSYRSDNTKLRTLHLNEEKTEYAIREQDGKEYVFTSAGLLKKIRRNGVDTLTVERDEKGLTTGMTGASGQHIPVEMDRDGHITRITLSDGGAITYAYDAEKNLTDVTNAAGGVTRYAYDEQGRMTEWYDAAGEKQVYNEYDEQGRVVYQEDVLAGRYALEYFSDHTVTTDAQGLRREVWFDEKMHTVRSVAADGGETRYTYNDAGVLASTTNAQGQTTAYEYDARGNLVQTTLANGGKILRAYDEAGNEISFTDALGNTTLYSYDANRNKTRQETPDGAVTTWAYDEQSWLTRMVDPLGAETRYAYDASGNLAETTDALGAITQYVYDANGKLIRETNALGEATVYAYDTAGNLTTLTFADETTVHYTYDAMNRVTGITDPLGNTTQYAYDALGNLTQTTYADGSTEQRAYTPGYQLESVTDALGATHTYEYDALGNLVRETDPLGQETRMEYDAEGRLLRKTLPNGAEMVLAYDPETGLLIQSTEGGLTNTFTYDAAGNLLERGLPGGAKLKNEYDSMGRLIRQTGLRGEQTELAYDLNGNIIQVTDALGGETAYEYDAHGNMTRATDALDNTTMYEYDLLGRLVCVTDALGGETRYVYDRTGGLVSVTDALGHVTAYEYDAAGNLAAMSDALGARVSLEYDKVSNATQTVIKNGGVLSAKYDKAGRLVQETDATGAKTQYAYDALGRVTEVTDALGSVAQFSYDAAGNITGITAPDGSQTLYEYDEEGRLVKTTDPVGLTSGYVYNELGMISAVESNGKETAYTYDAAGNILSVTDAEGREVGFKYDALGNVVAVTYPDGSADEMAYDALGRLVSEAPRDGVQRTYAYDALGNILKTTEGERETAYTYDALGQLIEVTLPDGATQRYAYDALGNAISETDALGAVTAYEYTPESLLAQVTYANGAKQTLDYDLAGRVTAETDALGAVTKYGYDKVGRLTQITDAQGGRTKYAYDNMDNLVKVKDALDQVTKYAYDAAGNLVEETDALQNAIRYSYTPEGWLESVTKADGTVVAYRYDLTGQLLEQSAGGLTITQDYNEIGQLALASGTDGEARYQYDHLGNLISVSYPNGDTVGYEYDEYSRKTGVIYPDGGKASYAYDNMDRLVRVEGADGETVEYAYDALGRRTETRQENLTTTYAYDAIGNLTAQNTTGDSALSLAYAYDPGGRMTREIRTENGGSVTSDYTYDKLGQLASYTRSDGYAESYRYDAAGNMVQKTADGQKTSMRYNKGNQLTEMRDGSGKISYAYDANGNLTTKQMGGLTDTYTYDALDRLTGYSGYDGFEQQYSLNAQGLRTGMTQQGSTHRRTLEEMLLEIELPEESEPDAAGWVETRYIWDVTLPYGQLLTETTGDSVTSYLYGLERISGTTSGNKTQYVYDGRGSVAQALTKTGNTVSAKSYAYTPFGSPLDEASRVTGFGYNAEYYDAATGMLNLRARQYEPQMGRFSQKDVLKGSQWLPQSLNRYAFVMNDPVGYADPSGEIRTAIGRINNLATPTGQIASMKSKVLNELNRIAGMPNVGAKNTAINNLIREVQSAHVSSTSSMSVKNDLVDILKGARNRINCTSAAAYADYIEEKIRGLIFNDVDLTHLSPEMQEWYAYWLQEYKKEAYGTPRKTALFLRLCGIIHEDADEIAIQKNILKELKEELENLKRDWYDIAASGKVQGQYVHELSELREKELDALESARRGGTLSEMEYMESLTAIWRRSLKKIKEGIVLYPTASPTPVKIPIEKIVKIAVIVAGAIIMTTAIVYTAGTIAPFVAEATIPSLMSIGMTYAQASKIALMAEGGVIAVGATLTHGQIMKAVGSATEVITGENYIIGTLFGGDAAAYRRYQETIDFGTYAFLTVGNYVYQIQGTRGSNGGAKPISEADRQKLSKWKYPPSDELYLKYKKVYDNPKYFNQATGEALYPPKDGFLNGASTTIQLQPGTVIDRYGSTSGNYLSPVGASYASRALPPFMETANYARYEVIMPLTVKAGTVAPWFDQPGLGTQYLTDLPVIELIKQEYLKPL